MYKLPHLIVLVFSAIAGLGQSPHGDDFKPDCALCHNADSWEVTKADMTFDHDTTQFKLTGQHLLVDCKGCHQTLKFEQAKSECRACHTDMHSNTVGQDCARCHTPKAWIVENTKMMHRLSRFPLEGNHAVVDCALCHQSASMLNFEPLGIECVDCHRKDYQATTTPNHQASGYPTDCIQCHGMKASGWTGIKFDHSSFPLTQGHNISCRECHKSGTYQKLSTECKSCHQTNFNTAQLPSHATAGISVDCKTCHTATGWKPSLFRHSSTGFELLGAHAAIVQCSACHVGNTTSAQPGCISCHQVQYNNAPGHVASKFPTDCRLCHNNNSWLGATFNHSLTSFPLTGAHISVQCASCHTAGYAGTSTECRSCHQSDYNSAANPNHQTLALSVICNDCHTTNPGWQPAKFPNHNTYFALSGAHAVIANDCAACHKGNYTTTPNTCYACHTSDYNNTTNPAHSAAQFPTNCTQCHTVNAWVPSTFNHDSQYFPIYSGKHNGKWTRCSECHTSATNFAAFSCIICHEHNSKTSVDNDHQGVNGYAYTGTSCYSCHPRGD